MSCQTSQRPAPPVVKIDWPVFPDPAGAVALSDDGLTVSMPTDYWLRVVQYVIDAEAGIEIFEGSRPAAKE